MPRRGPLGPAIVLAFGFANPALIYGLGAAALPVIIHLLNRRRFREEPWAAMRFLLAAVKKNARRIRIEQWILLAVRTLVVVLAVLAMAKPFLESLGAVPVIAGRRTHRLIVLDGSMSMGHASGNDTRFGRARALALQLVKDARRGDAISVVLTGSPPRVVVGDPSPNHGEVRKEIEEIIMPHGGTDLAASLEAIDRVLDASDIPQKEVIVLTDLQAASWRSPGGPGDEGLRRAVARLESRHARTMVIDLGKEGGENRGITDLRPSSPIVTAGAPMLVRAVLHNFGTARAEGVRARLVIDGRLGPEQTVDLPVGEDLPVAFTHTFTEPGEHLMELQIGDDALALDNHRWLSVPVREHVSVLLVDGHFKSEPFQAETDYLAQALSPPASAASEGNPSVVRTEVVPEGQLATRELSAFDVVVLCNIAQFTESEVAALDDFLEQGGGVVVFGGDQVIPENYNRILFADGKGLLPASIGTTVGDAATRQSSFGFNALGYRHPIVAPFAGESDQVTAGLTAVKTWQFHKLTLPPDSQAQVALAFDTGAPAVVEARRGRGTVVQIATSADSGWTTWPLHPSFPPVMEQVVLQAAAGRMAERNVGVGQPLEESLPGSGLAAAVTVVVPGGKAVASKLQAAGSVCQLHFEETELSGPYTVKVGPPLALESTFAANPVPAESDPAKLDRAGLAEAVPGWTFAYMTDWKSLTGDAAAVSRRGELHRPLLYLLLGALLLESFLAWRFGHHAPRA